MKLSVYYDSLVTNFRTLLAFRWRCFKSNNNNDPSIKQIWTIVIFKVLYRRKFDIDIGIYILRPSFPLTSMGPLVTAVKPFFLPFPSVLHLLWDRCAHSWYLEHSNLYLSVSFSGQYGEELSVLARPKTVFFERMRDPKLRRRSTCWTEASAPAKGTFAAR